ncbi:zinc-binding dehydrogenase [Micrococcus endophyticus]|uniref:zinc-binding dehydrogenase n=1 Tax=Micrococcus endophyticus TaxID=455343 RepID=UPI0034CFC7F6
MRAVIMEAPGRVVVTDRPDPVIEQPTDAVLRVTATCVCGSDLWPYRGAWDVDHARMGHEYMGEVVELGSAVGGLAVGDHVVGSFVASCDACEICRAGYPSRCVHAVGMGSVGTQAEYARIPLAGGTLVPIPGGAPAPDLVPSLLAASDVLGTGWFGAEAAQAGPGKTVAVVGDGAVGLLGVLAASQLGAERIVAFSRHEPRAALARAFGATDVIATRGEEGVAELKDLLGGLGAHSVIEAVGSQESMDQAIAACRPGGHVGFVGLNHGVALDGQRLFGATVHLHGGPAPVRRMLPDLIRRIQERSIDPGRVFDLILPLEEAAEAYAAMDERRAIKALLTTD